MEDIEKDFYHDTRKLDLDLRQGRFEETCSDTTSFEACDPGVMSQAFSHALRIFQKNRMLMAIPWFIGMCGFF